MNLLVACVASGVLDSFTFRKGAILCTNKDIGNRYFGTYGQEKG